MIDEYTNHSNVEIEQLKKVVTEGEYYEVLGLIQFILRHSYCTPAFRKDIDTALVQGYAAYRVFDRDTIIPISSEEEQITLVKAFADLSAQEFHGARKCLKEAGEHLTVGNFCESIRESIHGVESITRILESSGSFNGALTKLQRSAYIHPSLSLGFQKIYGYTSDEKGIRHPILEDPSKVDETDALFMIGACASFMSYLVNKARHAGLLTSKTGKHPR